jgi:isoleucyl-tRNA synthetase
MYTLHLFKSSFELAQLHSDTSPYLALWSAAETVDTLHRNNCVPMDELFKRYSPDVLRLWTLQQDFAEELKLSPQSLEHTVERYRKLRNTLRFCLQNLADFDFGVPTKLTHSMHRLQLVKLRELVATVQEAAGRHDFAGATSALMQYANVVSSEYFTAVKDALYCEPPDSPRRREAQFVLGRMLDTLMRLLVPVLPYTTEEVFQLVRQPMGCTEASALLLTLDGLHLPEVEKAVELRATYEQLSGLKHRVHRYVEAGLATGLKSPAQLELELTLPCSEGLFLVTPDELRDFFGVARVGLAAGASAAIRVVRTSRSLCPRCRRHDRLSHHSGLCSRCEEAEEALKVTVAEQEQ